jgi:hypothetical protein
MQELEVQKFLRSGNTLRNLSQKYNIQCNICIELNLVALNYTDLSPQTELIVNECKGLFLELDTWNVVCKSFNLFKLGDINIDDGAKDKFDWNTARLTEKLDGALICIYYYKDAWRIGMRMSADGSMQVTSMNGLPTPLSFAELTKVTLEEMGYKWEDYIAKLDPSIYYSFELCGPETRVGVIYSKRKLVLIGAIKSTDLSEIDIFKLDFPKEKPAVYPVKSKEDIVDILQKQSDPLKYEGLVLSDANSNRLKYKNPYYVEMMREPTPEEELEELEQLLKYVVAFATAPPCW